MRAAFMFLLGTSILAQVPPYRAEVTVSEVTLEITVTDRDGNPVTGLTADDLEILEEGKPVRVTYFREVDASGTTAQKGLPAPREPRTLFIFIDNDDIAESARHRLFESLRVSSTELLEGGAGVFLFLWNGKLQAVKPKDAATARDLLTKFEKDTRLVATAKARASSRRLGASMTPELVASIERTRSLDLIAALDAAARIAAKFPGRRIMLLVSRGFQFPSPTSGDVDAIERAAIAPLRDHALAGSLPDVLFAPEILGLTGRDAATRTGIGDAAAAVANRFGIPVYGLFSGGLEAAAIGARMDARGLPADPPPALVNHTTGSVADLAFRTGGTSFGAGLVFGPFLDSVARDLGHCYAVAYRATAELRFRRLEVRPKNRAWVVRHREAAVPDDRPPAAERRP